MEFTPQQLMNGLQKKNQILTQKNEEYKILVQQKADAEESYSIALSKKMLELQSDGKPITLIKDLAKGDKVVAGLKRDWDIKAGVASACLKYIDAVTNQIDSYRSILSWLKAEYERTN